MGHLGTAEAELGSSRHVDTYVQVGSAHAAVRAMIGVMEALNKTNLLRKAPRICAHSKNPKTCSYVHPTFLAMLLIYCGEPMGTIDTFQMFLGDSM